MLSCSWKLPRRIIPNDPAPVLSLPILPSALGFPDLQHHSADWVPPIPLLSPYILLFFLQDSLLCYSSFSCVLLLFGSVLVLSRAYSWLCAQRSLLAGLGGPCGVSWIRPVNCASTLTTETHQPNYSYVLQGLETPLGMFRRPMCHFRCCSTH